MCFRLSQVDCNSLLLAEESVFFTAKFSNPDFGGSSRLVELQDVDGDTLETVVAALLTATIKLDRDNIERFLHCADMLQASPALNTTDRTPCDPAHAPSSCSTAPSPCMTSQSLI